MEKSKLKVINKLHINYDVEWYLVSRMAKVVGIKTFAELEIYCIAWGIKNTRELYSTIAKDYRFALVNR